MRRGWWIIAAVIAAVSCGTSGGGKTGPGQDGGTGGDAGTSGDGGTDGGGHGGPGTDGGTDGGVLPGGPDGGPPDGGGGGFTTIGWNRVADRPLGTSEAHGELVGGKLYTFGGFNWATACCTPWRYAFVYDAATDAWSALADMPEGVTHAGTTTDGADVYYAGGFIEDASRTYQIFGTKHVWRYRVATNTYEALPELPVERGGGALQYLDGKLPLLRWVELRARFGHPRALGTRSGRRRNELGSRGAHALRPSPEPPRVRRVRREDLRGRWAARS